MLRKNPIIDTYLKSKKKLAGTGTLFLSFRAFFFVCCSLLFDCAYFSFLILPGDTPFYGFCGLRLEQRKYLLTPLFSGNMAINVVSMNVQSNVTSSLNGGLHGASVNTTNEQRSFVFGNCNSSLQGTLQGTLHGTLQTSVQSLTVSVPSKDPETTRPQADVDPLIPLRKAWSVATTLKETKTVFWYKG